MRTLTTSEVPTLFQRGETVFIPGSSAEPRSVVEALARASSSLPSIELVHSFVPSINRTRLASSENTLVETSIFPRHRDDASSVRLLPTSYFGYHRYLTGRSFDWTAIQVSPPDRQGRCSLGPSVEFLPAVLANSKRIIAVFNPNVPWVAGGSFLESERVTHCCTSDDPLVTYDPGEPDSVSDTIARNLTRLIDDGATLQLGLGKVPSRLLEKLGDRSGLRFHSGLLTEGFFKLLDAGAVDRTSRHYTCAALGEPAFYERLASTSCVTITGVGYTHAPATLAGIDSLVAINSALEVDLWGQANLEYRGGEQVSAVAGAADFAPAAHRSPHGKSVIVLPATAAQGSASRIVAQLAPSRPVSLPRHAVDVVVTEYGIAELAGRSPRERADALIAIAAPAFRQELNEQLQRMS